MVVASAQQCALVRLRLCPGCLLSPDVGLEHLLDGLQIAA